MQVQRCLFVLCLLQVATLRKAEPFRNTAAAFIVVKSCGLVILASHKEEQGWKSLNIEVRAELFRVFLSAIDLGHIESVGVLLVELLPRWRHIFAVATPRRIKLDEPGKVRLEFAVLQDLRSE